MFGSISSQGAKNQREIFVLDFTMCSTTSIFELRRKICNIHSFKFISALKQTNNSLHFTGPSPVRKRNDVCADGKNYSLDCVSPTSCLEIPGYSFVCLNIYPRSWASYKTSVYLDKHKWPPKSLGRTMNLPGFYLGKAEESRWKDPQSARYIKLHFQLKPGLALFRGDQS